MKKCKTVISKKNKLIFLSLIIYGIVLFHLTLFGRLSERINAISLQPMWSYVEILKTGNLGLSRQNFFNILAFMPLGAFLPELSSRLQSIWKVVLCGFLLSVTIESTQYLFHLGWCDIDDVFNNTLGSLLGFNIWHIARKFLQR